LLSADRQRRRKRSSSDLGLNYPGDLLSQVKPKRPVGGLAVAPLLKRNTVAEFAITRAYTSTASLYSTPAPPEQGASRPPARRRRDCSFSLMRCLPFD